MTHELDHDKENFHKNHLKPSVLFPPEKEDETSLSSSQPSSSLSSSPSSNSSQQPSDHSNDELVTTRRPRSNSDLMMMMMTTTTTTTPEYSKRPKLMSSTKKCEDVIFKDNKQESSSAAKTTAFIPYPSSIPLPSKSKLKALYEAALSFPSSPLSLDEKQEQEQEQGQYGYSKNDQLYLNPAGILSLEQVLLPALGLQEERALKKLQSFVQRDLPLPRYKLAMEDCRRCVRLAIIRAIQAVQQSKQQRCLAQERRREELKQERILAREQRRMALEEEEKRQALEKARAQQRARQERLRKLERQLPRNQALWKEVVVLTSSLTQLEKEERMWIQAEQELIQKISLVDEQQQQQQLEMDKSPSPHLVSSNEEESSSSPSLSSSPPVVPAVLHAPKDELQEHAESTLQAMVVASTRIQQGLTSVLKVLEESNHIREELYQNYREDHQFHGYQGIQNPKGMIRFLSQED